MSKAGSMRATSLRGFLAVMLFLTIAGAAVGFYLGLEQIRAYAIATNQSLIDADASGQQIEQLRLLQISLQESDSLVQKAQNVFVTQDGFQSQIVTDIQRYAREAGVAIEGTEFPPETVDDGATTRTDRSIEVRIASPVSYDRLIRFLQLVEGNIPKMQPDTVQVSRPSDPSGDSVTVGPMIIRMAVQ